MKIPFTDFELNFKKQDPNMFEVHKSVLDALTEKNGKYYSVRPNIDPKETIGDDQVLIPLQPIPMEIVFDVAKYSDVLRTIHQSLRKEIFREGYEIVENFAVKCNACEKEFDNPVDECDECKSTDLNEPNIEQKKQLIKFCKNVNDNDQDIINVSEEVNDDLEIIDDGYLVCIKDYYFDDEGKIVKKIPVEIIRADPQFMRLIADKQGRPARNVNGDNLYFCPAHRDTLLINEEVCNSCGKETIKAYYRSEYIEGKYMYYGKDECKHKSKYSPSLTYGTSVIYAVWMKVITLINMDVYMKDYYTKQRPPRGLLFCNTPNMDSLTKAWAWMLDEFKKNPHIIPPIGIENPTGTRGKLVEFIDFMRSLDEMQFIEARNEFRRQIGACYSVMPIFQADISTSGGLNNEGLQITVTNRAVKDGQGIYHDDGGFYVWICKQLEITDYSIRLPINEEQDMIAKEDLKIKKAQHARLMQEMGFSVTYNEEEDFEYDPVDEAVEMPDPFGQLGGMPGLNPNQSGGNSSFTGQPKKPGQNTLGPTNSLKKADDNPECEAESEKIKESAKTCKYPHKFKAAKWTNPNGHPRCKICGNEERTGGMCTKLK